MTLFPDEGTPFVGTHIAVRKVRQRRGGAMFGVYRPGSVSTFDVYQSLDEANFIAQYVEVRGGSYGSEVRHAAREAWLDRIRPHRVRRGERLDVGTVVLVDASRVPLLATVVKDYDGGTMVRIRYDDPSHVGGNGEIELPRIYLDRVVASLQGREV